MAPNRAMDSVSQGPGLVPSLTGLEDTAIKSHIKVVVRIRPENEAERESGFSLAVKPLDGHVLVFDPNEQQSPEFFHRQRRRGRDFMKKKNKDLRYAFDRVFDNRSGNFEIYENTTKRILDGLLDGYNCSVFAYGATGAGKTFTMLGSQQNPGVIFHTMMDLYQRIEHIKNEKTCQVAVSYLEVYNEQIRDLLVPSSFLPIREDPQRGVIIAGLSLHKPGSAEELLHMLEFGNHNRTQHPTDANAESSRSHAVFQVFVRQQDRTANLSADVRVAKMSLIDLAGSERATVTKNRGARFREGANINRSLLALGNCINALAEGKVKSLHVPYRNSKLTRLLKDSLGGNCRTVMIAAVSPSAQSYEDTHNTLKYANRAKNIKASLKRNVVSVDFHVTKYAKIVSELRTEVSELKIKLSRYEEGSVVPTPHNMGALPVTNTPHEQQVQHLQNTLHRVFKERRRVRLDLLELESNDRDTAFKINRKRVYYSRLEHYFLEKSSLTKAQLKVEKNTEIFQLRRASLAMQKIDMEAKMNENGKWLKRVESEMAGADNQMPEVLEIGLRTHHLEMELREKRREVKHLRRIARAQDRELQANEKLIKTLLQTAKNQFLILQGHGFATSEERENYNKIQSILMGEREVAWADQTMVDKPANSRQASDLDSVIQLPVLSCIDTTPKTPKIKSRTLARSPRGPVTPCSVRCLPTPSREHRPHVSNDGSPELPHATFAKTSIHKDTPHVNKFPQTTNASNNESHSQPGEGAVVGASNVYCDQTVTLGVSTIQRLNAPSSAYGSSSHTGHAPAGSVTPTKEKHGFERVVPCNDKSANQQGMNLVCKDVQNQCTTNLQNLPKSPQSNNHPQHNQSQHHTEDTSKWPKQSLNETFCLIENIPQTEAEDKKQVPTDINGESVSSCTVTKPQCLSGSATVTKSDRSPIYSHERKSSVVKSVARSMNFTSKCQSPAGTISYADAVKSPSHSSSRKPLQNVTNSPLAIPLDFSEEDDRGRKLNRKVSFYSHPKHQQQGNCGNHGNFHLTMAGQAQVTSFKNLRNHSFRASHKNTFHSKKPEGTISPAVCENDMYTCGQDNIRKLEKFGLPSMIRQPNYMKATAAVANRHQHGRSKSSSNLQHLRRLSSVPVASRIMCTGHEKAKPPARSMSLSRSKSSAQLNQRPAWNR